MVICVKVFGFSLMFIKLSSYSNLITHMFVISFVINRPSTCCFLSNQVLCLFKFIHLVKWKILSNGIDCFCRYTTVNVVVPSLSIDDNLVIEISGVVHKKRTKKNYSKGFQKTGGF